MCHLLPAQASNGTSEADKRGGEVSASLESAESICADENVLTETTSIGDFADQEIIDMMRYEKPCDMRNPPNPRSRLLGEQALDVYRRRKFWRVSAILHEADDLYLNCSLH